MSQPAESQAQPNDPQRQTTAAATTSAVSTPSAASGARAFRPAKVFYLTILVLIVASNAFLSYVLVQSTDEAIRKKQEQFGQLLAENLNHQIYRRFMLPTIVGFGRIELADKEQFDRLDKVVRSTIQGLNLTEIRIYDLSQTIAYSTNLNVVGKEGPAADRVRIALSQSERRFEVETKLSRLWGMFDADFPPGSVILEMVHPLKAEMDLTPGQSTGPIIGALEIYQDVTDDFAMLLRFQRLSLFTSLGSSAVLFTIVLMILRKNDRLNAERLAEKERLERELHQKEKLAGIGRMTAGIAHEIRNPLGIIRSSVELLLKRGQKDAKPDDLNARILNAVYEESKRLSQTVTDFLDYARPRTPKTDPVDLVRLLDQVLVFLESECAKLEIEVIREYASAPTVPGDKDLLYRAFYNIVANAMQAIQGKAGAIRLRLSETPEEARFDCIDSGPGFDESMLEKFLEPFFTTKDQGTGLGLAITMNIIESHGGRLALANEPGLGAKVSVALKKTA